MVVKFDTNFMNFMHGFLCVHCFISLVSFILFGQMYGNKCVVLKSFNHLTLLKVLMISSSSSSNGGGGDSSSCSCSM